MIWDARRLFTLGRLARTNRYVLCIMLLYILRYKGTVVRVIYTSVYIIRIRLGRGSAVLGDTEHFQ
jgi:hypothetical protein